MSRIADPRQIRTIVCRNYNSAPNYRSVVAVIAIVAFTTQSQLQTGCHTSHKLRYR
ncbi:hypothetical protein [Pontibacter burrus]|uniref:Uncharacterized protein n=1 Tax=Pontibacter burrus TaxID=2704466 RepID=A0A6B3LVS6_9BACT|nr:hypothetical protein [Pontibacter burrus]NEM97554.1 hypothetical protein [Pontibacter burrus]